MDERKQIVAFLRERAARFIKDSHDHYAKYSETGFESRRTAAVEINKKGEALNEAADAIECGAHISLAPGSRWVNADGSPNPLHDTTAARDPATMAPAKAEVPAALEALRELFSLVESGNLVRGTTRDGEPGYALRAMKLVMALKHAQELVARDPSQPRTTADEHAAATHPTGTVVDEPAEPAPNHWYESGPKGTETKR